MKAANQEFPLAMYELGRRYSRGAVRHAARPRSRLTLDVEGGGKRVGPAMVEMANALFYGRGVAQNPRRAVEWAQRAADSGSDDAKLNLGLYYFGGYKIYDSNGELDDREDCLADKTQALLWWGRAAADEQSARAIQYGAA